MTESDVDALARLEAIVTEAIEVPIAQRNTFLDDACGDDPSLRQRVESLLRYEADADRAFQTPITLPELNIEPDANGLDEQIGKTIGVYRIIERIGAGGMGNVYKAVRNDDAFDHTVAIKIIRRGLDTDDLLERFRRERQVLANLNHPNIARLLDGGATDDGRPYFVMEYVEGTSITRYCDNNQLTLTDRLKLFMSLCEAVQFAHRNLVVHRDLKPDNVLITEAGELKLLDFGIAKVLAADGDRAVTQLNAGGVRPLTPAYAAPEQMRGEPVTTATDVYALGVVLYELLCGCRPYVLPGKTAAEDQRIVCETEAVPPSRRVTEEAAIAHTRSTNVEQLQRRLRGDLDTIVQTALRKEPQRRYATADAVRDDIDRYLQRMPIAAHPDSWSYRASRFIARNRGRVIAAAAVFVILLAATIVLATLVFMLDRRTDDLNNALAERQLALGIAETERIKVQREARRAQSIMSVLINMFPELAQADPAMRGEIAEQIQQRSDRLSNMPISLSAEAEIATRQALALLARTINENDLALAENRRIIELAAGNGNEIKTLTEAWTQIGSIQLDAGDAASAVQSFEKSDQIEALDQPDHELSTKDLRHLEALLRTGDRQGAKDLLSRRCWPPSPLADYFHNAIRDLERQFDVTLMQSGD